MLIFWLTVLGAISWLILALLWAVTKKGPSVAFTVVMALLLSLGSCTDAIRRYEQVNSEVKEVCHAE